MSEKRTGQIVRVVNEGAGCVFSINFIRGDLPGISNDTVYLPDTFFMNFPFTVNNPEKFVGKRIIVQIGLESSTAIISNCGIEVNLFS